MAEERDGRNGAMEVLRSVTGMALVLWPREGVRAALPGDRRLQDLHEGELAELKVGASPLTVTERLIEREGGTWLVQQTGPAWAEPSEASADLCGLLFTRVDGSERPYAVGGRPPGPLPDDDELRRILAEASSGNGPEDGGEPDPEPEAGGRAGD